MQQLDEHNKRDPRGPYRVPNGYFSELHHAIVEKTQAEQPDNSWSAAFKRMAGFAAGFAFLAALAAGFFYITPEQNAETTAMQLQNERIEDFTHLYNVSEDDILEYYYGDSTKTSSNDATLAQAIDEYIDIYGTDITE